MSPPSSPVPTAHLAESHAEMVLIRRFEEAAAAENDAGRIPGPLHLSLGQEAVAVGVCGALRETDTVTSTHRGHHHCLAKGVDPQRLMAELLGRQAGWARGLGGSMHIVVPEVGLLGTNGIVGGGIPIAVGAAYSAQVRGTDDVTVCFFGEGAAATGAFGEALNFAGLWKLPIVFVCENNQWVELGPQEHHVAGRIVDRGAGYGIPAQHVDGNDVVVVREHAETAIARARAGDGPTLIEALTYRWLGHHAEDRAEYQPADERERWRSEMDPIRRAAAGITTAQAAAAEVRATDVVERAVAFARESPAADITTVMTSNEAHA